MKIQVDPDVLKEFEYIIKLHKEHGADYQMKNVKDMIDWILASVADGSRRPGSWERDMLWNMGLVANCEEHNVYRADYGPEK